MCGSTMASRSSIHPRFSSYFPMLVQLRTRVQALRGRSVSLARPGEHTEHARTTCTYSDKIFSFSPEIAPIAWTLDDFSYAGKEGDEVRRMCHQPLILGSWRNVRRICSPNLFLLFFCMTVHGSNLGKFLLAGMRESCVEVSNCKLCLTWKPCLSSPTPRRRRTIRTNSTAPLLPSLPLPVALKMRKCEKSKRKGRNNCHRRYRTSLFPA